MGKLGKKSKTERGFGLIEFLDAYNNEASIQESSLVEPHLWVGIENPKSMVLASQAKTVGIPQTQENGWQSYPIPEEVSIHSRMHLNRKQVEGLRDRLTYWLEKGHL